MPRGQGRVGRGFGCLRSRHCHDQAPGPRVGGGRGGPLGTTRSRTPPAIFGRRSGLLADTVTSLEGGPREPFASCPCPRPTPGEGTEGALCEPARAAGWEGLAKSWGLRRWRRRGVLLAWTDRTYRAPSVPALWGTSSCPARAGWVWRWEPPSLRGAAGAARGQIKYRCRAGAGVAAADARAPGRHSA